MVFGSTWQEDEKLIVKFIEENKFNNLLWIIAPHDISQTNINRVKILSPTLFLYTPIVILIIIL